MRSKSEQQDPIEHGAYRELQILSEVERTAEVTQRHLSKHAGIALGLTNALLRNLVKKGYVRATQASWKRWVYAVTPEGFSHKIRLTVAYVRRVLDHYQSIRQTLREDLAPLALHEESRVAICGTGEFAELVYLGLREIGIEEIEIFASDSPPGSRFLAMSVRDVATLQPEQYDRILVAILGETGETLAELQNMGAVQEKLVTFFADGRTREEA